MANNYLITGYWGEPHVTAENDRGINAAIFGTGRFVLSVGEQFRAEYIGNNTIRMYDGKLMDNGAAAGIPVGEFVDVLIANAGQNMKRNDLIVFQYSQDASTMIERGTFIVVQGEETAGTAVDPELTQSDLLSGKASLDQMALWRVPVSGTTISAPEQLFSVAGHGLGGNADKEIADFNEVLPSGWYTIGTTTENKPDLLFTGTAQIIAHDVSSPYGLNVQIAWGGGFCARRMFLTGNAASAEWEYETPPMYPGVEFRTTERWQGKAVYTKLVDLGALPAANSQISVNHGANATAVIRVAGVTSTGHTIPYGYSAGLGTLIDIAADTDVIHVWTGTGEQGDYSGKTGTAQIWYTKD